MEQTFSDMSVQMAAERAGMSRFVVLVARDVQEALRPGEFVLECADTTSPGFHSGLAVTNYRILIGTGPQQLQEIPLDSVTTVEPVQAPELALRLGVFDATYNIYGLGERGMRRVLHALRWVARYNDQPPATAQPENQLSDLYGQWIDLQRFFYDNPDIPDEEKIARYHSTFGNKPWW